MRWLSAAIWAELRASHAGSVLGTFWLFLAPLIQIGMYVFLFQIVWRLRVQMSAGSTVDFVWYLVSAYLPIWAFQDALSRASGALTGNAHIIRNTVFPPWLLVVARGLLPYAVLLAICVPLWIGLNGLGLFDVNFLDVFILLYVLICQASMTIGLALLLASLGLLIRDLANMIPPVLMGMVLSAPILYPMNNVPVEIQGWFWLNPLTAFAEAYHILLLTEEGLSWPDASVFLLCAIGSIALGIWAYRKVESDLTDLL